ncbi:MAG: restriction endonuclease subunit S, partial [Luteolibacter sp.]
WPMVELGELTKPEYGFTEKAAEQGDARFVRITDISQDGKLRAEDPKFITLTKEARESLLSNGDILVARTGATFGKTMIFEETYPAVFASFLIRLRFPKERVLPRYYWVFAQSELYWNQANVLMTGGGQPQFNGNALVQVKIPLPPLATQQAIVAEIEAEQALVAANRELIKRFERKIQAILARIWGEEAEPTAVDCGSPLSLSLPQPAAEEVASRLATPKRQQAAAVQVAPEPVPPPTKARPEPEASTAPNPAESSRPTHPDKLEKGELMALLREVLTEHGPCDRDTLVKQAATALGFQRVRETLADSLSNAIRTAVRRQVLLNGGSTYSVNRAGIADFDMDFLKTQFLAAVSEQGRVWTDRDDAIRAFARWFGFRRTGKVIDETARKLISRLLRGGHLEADGDSIRRK